MSGRSYRKAAGGVPESAREPVSGMPSWACGPADPNIPPGEGGAGSVVVEKGRL